MPTIASPRDLLKRHFGHREFLEGQQDVISSIIGGDDALVIMPTGGGKSLCYQLPALAKEGLTLVISPLIALMKDQVDALAAKGLQAAFINSSLTSGEIDKRLAQMRNGELKLVYIAPERFKSGRFLDALKDLDISLFALDEAHCLSQWGHDFRPDYLRLKRALKELGQPQVVALTATATPVVREDIKVQLELGRNGRKEPKTFVTGFARHNLTLAVTQVRGKKDKLERIREVVSKNGSGIVYCATRKNVEMVYRELRGEKIKCVAYHGAMDEEKRTKAQTKFMSGRAEVAVATNAFGMGIDRADLRFVMHYDIPGSVEAYYQEAGRAGRDGEAAYCELLFNYADVRTQEFFLDGANPTRAIIESTYSALKRLCRRGPIKTPIAKIATHVGNGRPNGMAVGTALRLLARAEAIAREYQGSRTYTTSLVEPVKDIRELGFDFDVLELKRERDGEKLRRIIQYTGDAGCRHRFILEYFGDPHLKDSCDACDNCRSRRSRCKRTVSEEEHGLIRQALSAVGSVNGRFGRGRIAAMLAGSRSKDVLDVGLDADPAYGALKAQGVDYAFSLLTELAQADYLRVSGDKYPVLSITELGRQAAAGVCRAVVAMPEIGKSPSSGAGRRAATAPAGPRNGALFEELRQWRFKKAKKSRVPAYMIFNDATLDELARVKPRAEEELLGIKGIGPNKARKLGKEVLAIIAESDAFAAPAQAFAPRSANTPPSDGELDFQAVEDDGWSQEEFNG
jgi:ATP-dependent DNA helicase RecQ